jgi:hydrogenase 3 maturation protease
MNGIVLTVGNDLMGDDGAGPRLAQRIEEEPIDGWSVIDGGTAPENVLHVVRAAEPDRVIVVDAARMGLAPGAIRFVEPELVSESFLLSTHALPVSWLIASLKETIPHVDFLGIEPARVEFFQPMTRPVNAAVDEIHRRLAAPGGLDDLGTFGRGLPIQ